MSLFNGFNYKRFSSFSKIIMARFLSLKNLVEATQPTNGQADLSRKSFSYFHIQLLMNINTG